MIRPDSTRGRLRRTAAQSLRPIDLSLILYAVMSAILAVSAGGLLARAARWGQLTDTISVSLTLVIIIVAGVSADSVLAWLMARSQPRGSDPRRP